MKIDLKALFKKAKEKTSGKLPPKFWTRFSKKQKIIAIVLAICVLAGSIYGGTKIFGGKEEKKGEITAFAHKGSVSSVIEGSGTIEALQQYEITSLIKGEVVADYFEEGDHVEKDDILYEMDNQAGYEAIDNALSSVKRAQRTYSNATEDIANLIVKSQTKGTVTNVYIEKGDSVGANAKIADVIDNSSMILKIQFLEDYARQMIANVSTATVTLTKNGTVLPGIVTKISTGSVISAVGSKVTNVEILVSNPGAIKEGDYATAEVGSFACSSEGTFANSGKSTITAKVSGTVEALDIMVGDSVKYGQRVAVLSNENVTDIDETYDNYEEAQKKYNDAVEGLEDYTVKAPISGTIIQKNIKAGEKLESMSGGSVMAIIADLSALVFEMSVDELDISKLSVGMDVDVKADAIENVTFGAKVTSISIVGSSNNGVTSYPVKITLNPKDKQTGAAQMNYDKLIPGLNVSASVVIERVEDVIVVPVSAVRRGNIVIVSEDSKSEGITIEESLEASRSAFSGASGGFGKNTASSDGNKTSIGGKYARMGIKSSGEISGTNKNTTKQNGGNYGNYSGGKNYGGSGNYGANSDAARFQKGAASSDADSFTKPNMPSNNGGYKNGGYKGGMNNKNAGSVPSKDNFENKGSNKNIKSDGKSKSNEKTEDKTKSNSKNENNKNSGNMQNQAAERIKSMLESVEVPEGYKAIIVETGLSDESFIEIKRGLSEGDKVLLPDATQSGGAAGGMGGFGGMGGMNRMPGMTGGMGGNRNFGSNNRSGSSNRSSSSSNRSFGSR
ncbi:MAG: HlyD family efflux transporter periplasmic adaptor subunit [Clostridia bacterium]|nr:HlyD family efflux transporter periplasmic adaptor subunit [Clostridia bacterium]